MAPRIGRPQVLEYTYVLFLGYTLMWVMVTASPQPHQLITPRKKGGEKVVGGVVIFWATAGKIAEDQPEKIRGLMTIPRAE